MKKAAATSPNQTTGEEQPRRCTDASALLRAPPSKAFETKEPGGGLDVEDLEAREFAEDDDASLLRFLVDMKGEAVSRGGRARRSVPICQPAGAALW